MNILRDALRSVDKRETGASLPDRVHQVLTQLASSRNVDEDARADIISIMDDAIELASAMVNSTYPVELILRRVTNILATSQRILMHTETFRPGRLAFGAMLPDGQLLDFVASSQEEAHLQLERLMSFGVPRTAVVVPVRVSSQYVMQPQVRPQLTQVQPPAQISPAEAREMMGMQRTTGVVPPPLSERDQRSAEIRAEINAIADRKDANSPVNDADQPFASPGLASTFNKAQE